MKKTHYFLSGCIVLLAGWFWPKHDKTTIFLAGDSTMSIKATSAYPETGWGMPFVYFWDSTVLVDNRAMNGRSTLSFINEGRWQSIEQALQPGDYVFIQFGHNDEKIKSPDRYSGPGAFKKNLLRFVNETRAKKAIPVLLTPVARRHFDSSGHIMETHAGYKEAVIDLAKEEHLVCIDLDQQAQELYTKWGPEWSKKLFVQLEPGEHPNYPEGREDNTHFSELGARLIAEIVLKNIREKIPALADHLVKSDRKK